MGYVKRISILAFCLIAVYAMATVVAGGVYAEGTPKEKLSECLEKVAEEKGNLAEKKEEQKSTASRKEKENGTVPNSKIEEQKENTKGREDEAYKVKLEKRKEKLALDLRGM